jgi:hypothetical protein
MTDIPSRSFGSKKKWYCKTDDDLLTLFNATKSELLDRLPNVLRNQYAGDFRLADDGFWDGRVVSTTQTRESYWVSWESYVQPLGVDPLLQDTPFVEAVRAITGFTARVRIGGFGHGRVVKADTVSTAISAVGKEITLACGVNPTKLKYSEKSLPRIAQMLDRWRKKDEPVMKKLPVEVDVPEYLVKLGLAPGASELVKATGDLSLIAIYYLLRIGEYTTKGSCNESKQTVQYRMRDVVHFGLDSHGKLKQLPRDASDEEILEAQCTSTLRLDNQKNGWRNVCVNHHHNGDDIFSPVRAIGRRYIHIRKHMKGNWNTPLSAVWDEQGKRMDVTDKIIRRALKLAATALEYPERRGIPIERVDTHSLRIGGANALHLAGYSDREIQKMGRWRGDTFKEYVREQLLVFSEGMSRKMSKKFEFVNIEGGVCYDISRTVIGMAYNNGVTDAAAAV